MRKVTVIRIMLSATFGSSGNLNFRDPLTLMPPAIFYEHKWVGIMYLPVSRKSQRNRIYYTLNNDKVNEAKYLLNTVWRFYGTSSIQFIHYRDIKLWFHEQSLDSSNIDFWRAIFEKEHETSPFNISHFFQEKLFLVS